ncbi:hypothetical protein AgCh_036071 [Apium graveolens]
MLTRAKVQGAFSTYRMLYLIEETITKSNSVSVCLSVWCVLLRLPISPMWGIVGKYGYKSHIVTKKCKELPEFPPSDQINLPQFPLSRMNLPEFPPSGMNLPEFPPSQIVPDQQVENIVTSGTSLCKEVHEFPRKARVSDQSARIDSEFDDQENTDTKSNPDSDPDMTFVVKNVTIERSNINTQLVTLLVN